MCWKTYPTSRGIATPMECARLTIEEFLEDISFRPSSEGPLCSQPKTDPINTWTKEILIIW